MLAAQPSHVPSFVLKSNRYMRQFAGHRYYALLLHVGRKSGKPFETPVMAWPTARGLVVPLTWGTKTDWYRNTMAADACAIQISGRWFHCAEPVLIDRDQALSLLPPLRRTISRLFPIKQFLLLRSVERTS